MKTVVLMWNPAISSFHKEDLSKCASKYWTAIMKKTVPTNI